MASPREIPRYALVLAAAVAGGCSSKSSVFASGGGGSGPGSFGDGGSPALTTGVGFTASDGGIVTVTCAAGSGSACIASCPSGTSTTLHGTVFDPAGLDPLYNVAVFIPNAALPDLPTGASCGQCSAFFPQAILTSTTTGADGTFELTNVPAGSSVPIVVQAGKWRRVYSLDVEPCVDNAVTDGTLRLPRDSSEGDLPDIAISTGGADSLECLLLRIGVSASEYVAGDDGAGHIHIFNGFAGAVTAEPTPSSPDALWDSSADLVKNDLVLLSCEGQETAGVTTASQQALLDYASNGGRVFASHYHYVWFDVGPFGDYPLARWTTGAQIVVPGDSASAPGDVLTTLPSGQPFPEGVALAEWLDTVGALSNAGDGGGGMLPIWYARHNADVPTGSGLATPWIALDPSVMNAAGATQYLSFETPIGSASPCGRVVYSDLHVSGGPDSDEPGVPPDYPDAGTVGTNRQGGVVPSGCAMHPLTAQEKALEFMLFDLSSACLVPIGGTPYVPR
jgi:hypothetical protein